MVQRMLLNLMMQLENLIIGMNKTQQLQNFSVIKADSLDLEQEFKEGLFLHVKEEILEMEEVQDLILLNQQ